MKASYRTAAYYLILVFIGVGIAVVAFRSFDSKRRQARAFSEFTRQPSLTTRLQYLAPHELNVRWEIGDSAIYSLESVLGGTTKQLHYEIAAPGLDKSGRKWLLHYGQREIAKKPIRIWRLLKETDIRNGAQANMGLIEIPGFITYPYFGRHANWKLAVESLGKERLELKAGSFETERLLISVQSMDEREEPFLEVWVSQDVSPLGIVQARWQGQRFTLTEHRRGAPDSSVSEEVLSIVNQAPITTFACSRCHGEGEIGGMKVASESPFQLSGEQLHFPKVLHHWRQAGIELEKEVSIQFAGMSGDPTNRMVRFETQAGTLEVHADERGRVPWMMEELDPDQPLTLSSNDRLIISLPSAISLQTQEDSLKDVK